MLLFNYVFKVEILMQELKTLLDELKSQSFFNENEICVIGCSTSEVIGQKIGSVGSMEVAEASLMH